MVSDLELAFHLADLADSVTRSWWRPTGVASTRKVDGSPVTEADTAAETAVLMAVRDLRPGDGFIGEEVGELLGTTGRRWIVDGIDGTTFFAAGQPEWGTLIALECDDEVVIGVSSSPMQDQRWWASRGQGAYTGRSGTRSADSRIRVSTELALSAGRFATLPAHDELPLHVQQIVERLAGGRPRGHSWHVVHRVADGELDMCLCFGGDVWDHAAPSILVEEAGGRFNDHRGGRRLDTRTAIYSNGLRHDEILAALALA